MPDVAPTAVVDATAQLGSDVRIGPGCVIGASVVIGDRCELKTNVVICRGVRIGAENRIFANCVLGEEPQIVDECDPQTELIIGDGNVFRENVTINRGSLRDTGKTMIGGNAGNLRSIADGDMVWLVGAPAADDADAVAGLDVVLQTRRGHQ